jgi:hypothetical protein
LPNNDSWEFVVETHGFAESSNPFPIPEDYVIDGLRFHSVQNHFVGIKVGDINQSYQLVGHDDVNNRSLPGTSILADDRSFEAGEELTVSLVLDSGQQPEGMQFAVTFDPQKLDFEGMMSGSLRLNSSNYHLMTDEPGVLKFSWNRTVEIDTEGDLLFTMVFRSKASGKLSECIALNSAKLPAEIYFSDRDEMKTEQLVLRFTGETGISDRLVLYQNTPNPFSAETRIEYYVPESTEVVLTLFDMDGRLVYEDNNRSHAGYGEFVINNERADLREGIYYYSVKAGKDISTRKMIVIR